MNESLKEFQIHQLAHIQNLINGYLICDQLPSVVSASVSLASIELQEAMFLLQEAHSLEGVK